MTQVEENKKKVKRQPRIREYAAPWPVKLGRHQESLCRFFDRLGKVVYGLNWKRPASVRVPEDVLDIHPIGSEKEQLGVVYDHILSGLRCGSITAIVILDVIVEQSVRNIAADDPLV